MSSTGNPQNLSSADILSRQAELGQKRLEAVTPFLGDEIAASVTGQLDIITNSAPFVGDQRALSSLSAALNTALGPVATIEATQNKLRAEKLNLEAKNLAQQESEKKVGEALTAMDGATPSYSTEASKLTKDEKEKFDVSFVERRVTKYVTDPRAEYGKLTKSLQQEVASGKIPQEIASKIQVEINNRLTREITQIESEISSGLVSPATLEARIAQIPNKEMKQNLTNRFNEAMKPTRMKASIDAILVPTSTVASVEAALAAKSPEEANELRTEINKRISSRAETFKTAIESGQMSVAEARTTIATLTPYEQQRTNGILGGLISGSEFQRQVNTISNDISGIDRATAALNAIMNAPEFSNLPPAQAKVIREAARHQINRLRGTDLLYRRTEQRMESERNLRTLEINRKNWEIMRTRIRRLVLPAAAVAGIGVLSGLGVGIGFNTTIGGILAGLGAGGLATGVGLYANHILEHNLHYVSQSRLDMQKLENERRTLIEKDQEIYTNIHTVRAERTSMPLQALNEVSKLAAEAAWIRIGRNSGVPRDQWINSFLQQTTFSDLDKMRQSISAMTLVPSNIPLTSGN